MRDRRVTHHIAFFGKYVQLALICIEGYELVAGEVVAHVRRASEHGSGARRIDGGNGTDVTSHQPGADAEELHAVRCPERRGGGLAVIEPADLACFLR